MALAVGLWGAPLAEAGVSESARAVAGRHGLAGVPVRSASAFFETLPAATVSLEHALAQGPARPGSPATGRPAYMPTQGQGYAPNSGMPATGEVSPVQKALEELYRKEGRPMPPAANVGYGAGQYNRGPAGAAQPGYAGQPAHTPAPNGTVPNAGGYAQPGTAQPTYGQPNYATPNYGQPGYGANGQPTTATPGYGLPPRNNQQWVNGGQGAATGYPAAAAGQPNAGYPNTGYPNAAGYGAPGYGTPGYAQPGGAGTGYNPNGAPASAYQRPAPAPGGAGGYPNTVHSQPRMPNGGPAGQPESKPGLFKRLFGGGKTSNASSSRESPPRGMPNRPPLAPQVPPSDASDTVYNTAPGNTVPYTQFGSTDPNYGAPPKTEVAPPVPPIAASSVLGPRTPPRREEPEEEAPKSEFVRLPQRGGGKPTPTPTPSTDSDDLGLGDEAAADRRAAARAAGRSDLDLGDGDTPPPTASPKVAPNAAARARTRTPTVEPEADSPGSPFSGKKLARMDDFDESTSGRPMRGPALPDMDEGTPMRSTAPSLTAPPASDTPPSRLPNLEPFPSTGGSSTTGSESDAETSRKSFNSLLNRLKPNTGTTGETRTAEVPTPEPSFTPPSSPAKTTVPFNPSEFNGGRAAPIGPVIRPKTGAVTPPAASDTTPSDDGPRLFNLERLPANPNPDTPPARTGAKGGPSLTPPHPLGGQPRLPEVSEEDEQRKLSQTIPSPNDSSGFKGYCPVTLKLQRRLVRGLDDHAAQYHGRLYLFATAEAKAEFENAPQQYTPVRFGRDVVLLSGGEDNAEGTIDHAAWFRGRLYFFKNKDTRALFFNDPKTYADDAG